MFDLRFHRTLAPRLASALWALVLVTALAALALVVVRFADGFFEFFRYEVESDWSAGEMVAGYLTSRLVPEVLIPFFVTLVAVLLARLVLESALALVRIAEASAETADLRRRQR